MFQWLRKKLVKGSKEKFNAFLDLSYNFIKYAEKREFINPTPIDIGAKFDFPHIGTKLSYMSQEIFALNKEGYNSETWGKALDLDTECRKLWAIAYGGSNLKYNSEFKK
jgi:hypothetical protein